MLNRETDEFIKPEIVSVSLFKIIRRSFIVITGTAVSLQFSINVNARGLLFVLTPVPIFEYETLQNEAFPFAPL
jgi:hypothetical protein